MITSFFNTSKPIHLVIAGIFILTLLIVSSIDAVAIFFSIENIQSILIKYAALLSTVLVLSFFVNKNGLTEKNSYNILFYCLLLALIPNALADTKVIWANFFVILAIRRIISLRNNLRIKKKLFDSAFWIVIASLFYFWSILFLILVMLALIMFSIGQIKNWIIPLSAVMVIVIILVSINIIFTDSYGSIFDYFSPVNFDITNYNSLNFIIPISIFLSLGVWATFFYIKNFSEKARAYRPAFSLVVVGLIISLLIVGIAPSKNGNEFLFSLAPMAIIMSNYIESVNEKWFKEVYVWLIVITPFVLLIL